MKPFKSLFAIVFGVLLFAGVAFGAGEVSSLTALAEAPASGDLVEIVDVSDTTMAATGTNKKITTTNLLSGRSPVTISRTEFIPVGWMIDGASAPDALETVDVGTRQVKARTFAADASEDVELFWQAPHDIIDGDSGTAGFQVKWRPVYVITAATAPASGEGVTFSLASCSAGDSDDLDCTVGTESVVAFADLDGHAQFDVVYGTYTAMTVDAGAAAEAWMMKLYRDHDHESDDYAQLVGLIGIEVKYKATLADSY